MRLNRPKTLLSTAVLAALSSTGVYADAALEEVLVTAERREASIQDTPISMQAFDDRAIQERGITSISDLFKQISGVYGYTPPGSTSSPGFNIRGIGDGASTSIFVDPATAKYVDGIILGKAHGSGVDMVDLQRVEVLKGPQGTLYGRNSTAGAVNFITRAPSDEFGVDLRASLGEYNLGGFSGRIDMPISETFRASASYYNRSRDGFWDQRNTDLEEAASLDRDGYRLAFEWTPSDKLTVSYAYRSDNVNDETAGTLQVAGLDPDLRGFAGYYLAGGDPGNVSIRSDSRPGTVALTKGGIDMAVQYGLLPPLPQFAQYSQWAGDYINWANGILANDGNRELQESDLPSLSSSDTISHNLRVTYELSDNLEFRYFYGTSETDTSESSDLDGMDNRVVGGVIGDLQLLTIGGLFFGQVSPAIPASIQFGGALDMMQAINNRGRAEVFSTVSGTHYEQESHEFQLVGTAGDVNYAAGFFFLDEEGEFRNVQSPTYPLAGSNSRAYDSGTDTWSVFGEATWRPNDGPWAFTFGLRYTEETKKMTYLWRDFAPGTTGLAGYLGAAVGEAFYGIPNNFNFDAYYFGSIDDWEKITPSAGVYGNKHEQDFDNVSGRFVVQYDFNDNINAYASYTTGYKSGGFNGGYYYVDTQEPDAFEEETIESLELGIKAMLLDNTLRLNAAVYSYDYDDVQVSVVETRNNNISSSTGNGGKIGREGFELEMAWQATDSLQFRGYYSFIDGGFDQYPDYLGLKINPANAITPENAFSVAADWDFARWGSHVLNFTLNVDYQDETVSISAAPSQYTLGGNIIPVNFQQAENHARTIVDARLSWEHEMSSGGTLSVAAWARNLTNEEYRTFGYNYGASLGLAAHMWGDPSTFGIDINFRL